jgi:ABC-2 type transport system ATP-binding protein
VNDTPALVLDDVHKVYPTPGGDPVEAVRGISLEMRRGEVFGLLGPNGAGKTTTIGMITTRHEPTSGTIRVDGVDVVADPATAKRHVGVAPQAPNLDNALTVWEVLYLHARYFGVARATARRRADELLERFRLTEKAGARPIELSGGMVRRLLLCRALAHDPTLLVLDEATVGIDPQTRRLMWDEISAQRDEGRSVLVTTHYIEEADVLCDRVAIVDHGVLLAVDSPAALKQLVPAGTRIELALGDDGRDDAVAAVTAVATVAGVEPTGAGLRVYASGGESAVPDVVGAVIGSGATMHHVSVHEPSLEDVFIHFTGREMRE